MSDVQDAATRRDDAAAAAVMVLTGVMLLALVTRTPPHPPLDVPLFALAPFLGASLAIGAASLLLVRRGGRRAMGVVGLFVVTALISFGPQKYFDPGFPQIWPAVVTAQAAVAVIAGWCILTLRRK